MSQLFGRSLSEYKLLPSKYTFYLILAFLLKKYKRSSMTSRTLEIGAGWLRKLSTLEVLTFGYLQDTGLVSNIRALVLRHLTAEHVAVLETFQR